jgi:hypothetical protein
MAFRITINELMDKIGVGRVLGPYESQPWSAHDAEKGLTCQAEVRMGGGNDEIEAEAQMVYDTPPPGKPPMEHVCYIRLVPVSGGQWNVTALRVRGAPYGKDIYNWEQKSCDFFNLIAQHLQRNQIPNIDELIEEAFASDERFRGTRGGGGKSPKIKTSQLLDMKKGRGF